jgi:DNA-binding NtrC family response regulator
MPGIGGLRALEEFLKIDAEAVVLMITAYATFDTAIAAWEKGAFGCIRKPFQNEHITAASRRGHQTPSQGRRAADVAPGDEPRSRSRGHCWPL